MNVATMGSLPTWRRIQILLLTTIACLTTIEAAPSGIMGLTSGQQMQLSNIFITGHIPRIRAARNSPPSEKPKSIMKAMALPKPVILPVFEETEDQLAESVANFGLKFDPDATAEADGIENNVVDVNRSDVDRKTMFMVPPSAQGPLIGPPPSRVELLLPETQGRFPGDLESLLRLLESLEVSASTESNEIKETDAAPIAESPEVSVSTESNEIRDAGTGLTAEPLISETESFNEEKGMVMATTLLPFWDLNSDKGTEGTADPQVVDVQDTESPPRLLAENNAMQATLSPVTETSMPVQDILMTGTTARAIQTTIENPVTQTEAATTTTTTSAPTAMNTTTPVGTTTTTEKTAMVAEDEQIVPRIGLMADELENSILLMDGSLGPPIILILNSNLALMGTTTSVPVLPAKTDAQKTNTPMPEVTTGDQWTSSTTEANLTTTTQKPPQTTTTARTTVQNPSTPPATTTTTKPPPVTTMTTTTAQASSTSATTPKPTSAPTTPRPSTTTTPAMPVTTTTLRPMTSTITVTRPPPTTTTPLPTKPVTKTTSTPPTTTFKPSTTTPTTTTARTTTTTTTPTPPPFMTTQKYSYGYSIADQDTGDYKSASEIRDGDTVKGEYRVLEPDGFTLRIVRYWVSPGSGFRAEVEFQRSNFTTTTSKKPTQRSTTPPTSTTTPPPILLLLPVAEPEVISVQKSPFMVAEPDGVIVVDQPVESPTQKESILVLQSSVNGNDMVVDLRLSSELPKMPPTAQQANQGQPEGNAEVLTQSDVKPAADNFNMPIERPESAFPMKAPELHGSIHSSPKTRRSARRNAIMERMVSHRRHQVRAERATKPQEIKDVTKQPVTRRRRQQLTKDAGRQ